MNVSLANGHPIEKEGGKTQIKKSLEDDPKPLVLSLIRVLSHLVNKKSRSSGVPRGSWHKLPPRCPSFLWCNVVLTLPRRRNARKKMSKLVCTAPQEKDNTREVPDRYCIFYKK